MKKLLLCSLAAASLISACATVESSNGPSSAARAQAKEDFVTGSRIPRSESNENYQGAKSMTRQDYEDYKNPTGAVKGN